MAVAAACFKWADVLENQFDKSWVELDTILCQLEDDEVKEAETSNISKNLHPLVFQDFGMLHLQGRRAASSLASCFSQFAHKSTTVFQVRLLTTL